MKKRKGFLGLVFLIALIIVLLLYIVPLPVHLNKEIAGVILIDLEDGDVKSTDITIEGYYLKYLFKNNEFRGNIQISGYAFTDGELMKVTFSKSDQNVGNLVYYYESEFYTLGLVFPKGMFDELVIKNGGVEGTYTYIMAPAENYSEAVEIYEQIFKE